jgi:hypothetical protein
MQSSRSERKRRPKRKNNEYHLTKGQINRIIDIMLHRHFKKKPGLILLDSLAHLIVEDNPKESARKFLKYNAPVLLEEALRQKRRQKKQ